MSDLWWGVAIAAVIALLFWFRSKRKAVRSFTAVDEADSWFLKNNISSGSVRFNTYEGPGLARNPGAVVIVGMGRNGEGESVGFALEIVSGKGVVASEILVPDGIALEGNTASRRAKISGQPLLDVLARTAADHRARYPTAR